MSALQPAERCRTHGPERPARTLGSTLKRLDYGSVIDPAVDQSHLWREMPLRADGRWLLGQGALYLGVTDETVTVPANTHLRAAGPV